MREYFQIPELDVPLTDSRDQDANFTSSRPLSNEASEAVLKFKKELKFNWIEFKEAQKTK